MIGYPCLFLIYLLLFPHYITIVSYSMLKRCDSIVYLLHRNQNIYFIPSIHKFGIYYQYRQLYDTSLGLARRKYISTNKYSVVSKRSDRKNKKNNQENNQENNQDQDLQNHGKTLVIVESPAKSKTIQKFLPEDKYIVDYCAGHIRDFPTSVSECPPELKKISILDSLKITVSSLGINVYDNFQPIYVPMRSKLDLIARLKELSTKVDQILLATDEDREGEAISWHLIEELKPKIPYKRAVFHEITQSAITEAFTNPRDIDMSLVSSQEARKLLDRLVGYSISPVLWRYITPGISAGRVQSCGLKLIAERERKRWDFKSSNYFSIEASFTNQHSNIRTSVSASASASSRSENVFYFDTKLYSVNGKRIATEKDFDGSTGELSSNRTLLLTPNYTNILLDWFTSNDSMYGPKYIASEIDTKLSSRKPPLPYITSTLQQDGSNRLGLSPSVTMKLAQELYENGYITYMRTDSPTLSDTAIAIGKGIVSLVFGKDYIGNNKEQEGENIFGDGAKNRNKAPKNAQEAHEAIRPAEMNGRFKFPDELDISDKKKELYSMIYRRTIASLMKSSQSSTRTYSITAKQHDTNTLDSNLQHSKHFIGKKKKDDYDNGYPNEAIFKASETIITYKGFLAAYGMYDNGYYDRSKHDTDFKLHLSKNQSVYLSNQKRENKNIDVDRDVDIDIDGMEHDTDNEENRKDQNKGYESIRRVGIEAIRHHTRPVNRYTESSFIKELESIGVGRPSTYSKIIQILKEREYIIVDKRSLIPTIKGLVVSNLLEKHFSELVDPEFTAALEDSLDDIANGSKDKIEFLQEFYLGSHSKNDDDNYHNDNHLLPASGHTGRAIEKNDKNNRILSDMNTGLLYKIASKLDFNAIDQTQSRILDIPYLSDIGTLQFSRYGVFIDCNSHVNNNSHVNSSISSSSSSFSSSTTAITSDTHSNIGLLDWNSTKNLHRWRLPDEMQKDIRLLSKDSLNNVISTSLTITGKSYGTIADSNGNSRILSLKSGRYGKYVQLGLNKDKNMIRHAIPNYLDSYLNENHGNSTNLSHEELLEYVNLPKKVYTYQIEDTGQNLDIYIDCNNSGLFLSVKGYTIKYPIEERNLLDITEDVVISYIDQLREEMRKERSLGYDKSLDGKDTDSSKQEIVIRKSRFGYYLRRGDMACGLGKKYDPVTITLEEAIGLLGKKGKPLGIRSKGKKVKKIKKMKAMVEPKARGRPKKKTMTMTNLTKDEKSYDIKQQQQTTMMIATAELADEEKQKSKTTLTTKSKMKIKTKSKSKLTSEKKKKKHGGDDDNDNSNIVAAVVENSATSSKRTKTIKIKVSNQILPKTLNEINSNNNNDVDVETVAMGSVRRRSGYQLYISEMIKTGNKLGDATKKWKTLSSDIQQKYNDKAKLLT